MLPHGATSPKCGERERVSRMGGTILEYSHVKMTIWLQAIYLMVGSKKGISNKQLHRILCVILKTVWFMSHRIRETMRSSDLAPTNGGGAIVEVDGPYYGTSDDGRKRRAKHNSLIKNRNKPLSFNGGAGRDIAVLSLVDRSGRVQSFKVKKASKKNLLPILRDNLDAEAKVITDESGLYGELVREYVQAFVATGGKNTGAASSTPTPLKAIFRSSSGGCAVCTGTAKRNICIAISWNLTSATATVGLWALDLSRSDAAPLIAFTALKETDDGTETDGWLPPKCGAHRADKWAFAQSGG